MIASSILCCRRIVYRNPYLPENLQGVDPLHSNLFAALRNLLQSRECGKLQSRLGQASTFTAVMSAVFIFSGKCICRGLRLRLQSFPPAIAATMVIDLGTPAQRNIRMR